MTTLMNNIQLGLWNIGNRLGAKDVVDIIIVAFIIYQLIKLIHKTRSSAVLKGLVLMLAVTGISKLMGLNALYLLLKSILDNGVLALVILFQPEVRKALESLGRGSLIGRKGDTSDHDHIVGELVQCAVDLSRRRVGALIVFEQKTGLNDFIENGTNVDATISAPLLENIFEPNTPLHDGAVIIRDERIVAAACILELTKSTSVSKDLGTRHRAGIGISEQTDALVLIVS